MKKLYLSLILALTLCLTACGTDKNKGLPRNDTASSGNTAEGQEETPSAEDKTEPSSRTGEAFTLTENGKVFLEQMCHTLNEFDSQTAKDDAFWRDFLFYSYTGVPEGASTEQIRREDSELEETVVKVSLEDARAYAKLIFGLELPDLKPSPEDMDEGQTSCYFQDGFYYIGVSDFPDYRYTFSDCKESGDSVTVSYTVDFEDESNVGTIRFTLVPEDNENGFIITSKTWSD